MHAGQNAGKNLLELPMKMSGRSFLAIALLAVCGAGTAQDYYDPGYRPDYAYDFNPGTGDAVLDALLRSLNTYYASDVGWYVDDIVYSTGAPRGYVENMIVDRRYPPADVYLIAQTASITGQPIANIQREFDSSRGQGWGVVAKRLGIKPGSPEFHRLKSGADSWSTRAKVKVKQKGGKARRTVVTESSRVIVRDHPKTVHPGKSPGPGKGHAAGKSNGKGQGKDKKNK